MSSKRIAGIINTALLKRKEYDADRESIFILEQAGYNPRAVEQMMSALVSLSQANALQVFFDAHPNTEDRLKEISEILEDPALVFLSLYPLFTVLLINLKPLSRAAFLYRR